MKKKKVMMTIALLCAVAQGAWAWDGNGTKDSPWLIATTTDLDALADGVNGGTDYYGNYFCLDEDLTYGDGTGSGDANFTPIGHAERGTAFRGHFNGQRHIISGIILEKAYYFSGLFGHIGSDGYVENVILDHANVVGKNGTHTGGIAGTNDGTVANCIVANSFVDGNAYGGAIVGGETSGTLVTNYYINTKVFTMTSNVGASGQDRDGARGINTFVRQNGNIDITVQQDPILTYQGTDYWVNGSEITVDAVLKTTAGYTGEIRAYYGESTFHSFPTVDSEGKTTLTFSMPGNRVVIRPMPVEDLSTIYNVDQMELLHQKSVSEEYYTDNKTFVLANDLDFSSVLPDDYGCNYHGIGRYNPSNMSSYYFSGTFDGQGHTVSGIINNDAQPTCKELGVGMFPYISGYGTVKNLTIDNSTFSCVGNQDYYGALADYSDGHIENCHVGSGVVINGIASFSTGGLVGCQHSKVIEGCTSSAVINLDSPDQTVEKIGGIVGYHQYHTPQLLNSLYMGDNGGKAEYLSGWLVGYYSTDAAESVMTNNFFTNQSLTPKRGKDIKANIYDLAQIEADGCLVNYGGPATATYSYGGITAYPNGLVYQGKFYTTLSLEELTVKLELEGSGTADDPYLVGSADDWKNVKDISTVLSGVYFKQTADFTTSEMVGSSDHPFASHYDGGDYTLTFNAGTADSPISQSYLAPFRYVAGATIQNLHTAGTIYTSAQSASGMVGGVEGDLSITNCLNIVCINSSRDGDGTDGGFVGIIKQGATNITDCVFAGELNGTNTVNCGGFIGWTESNNNAKATITDCMFAPASVTLSNSGCKTFARARDLGKSLTINNSDYLTQLGDGQGTQYVELTIIDTAKDYVSIEMGDAVKTYDMIGLTYYDNAIVYGEQTYVKANDKVTVNFDDSQGYRLVRFICNGTGSSFDDDTTNPATLNTGTEPITIDMEKEEGWAGSGTADDPYIINSVVTMDMLAQKVNASSDSHFDGIYFTMTKDIEYDGTENNYTPVGLGSSITTYFGGVFDGQGHSISGINITSDASRQALFGVVNGGTVKGVTLKSSTINGQGDGHSGIVGYLNGGGLVDDCHVATTVCLTGRNYVGGIVGSNMNGSISHCSSGATVNGNMNIGGIVGGNGFENGTNNCILQDNIYYGTSITGSGNNKGAIAGNNNSGSNNTYTYARNYYTASNLKGVKSEDITADDGAVPALHDDADNSVILGLLAELSESIDDMNVSLYGRTFYHDGSWNTICLPFSVEDFHGTIFEDATVKTLASSLYRRGTLTLNFEDADGIEAGVPYIVKWTDGDNDENPVFEDVVVSSTTCTAVETDYTDFIGSYSPINLDADDRTVLYLGADNQLYYPTVGMTVNSFRAVFRLKGLAADDINTSTGVNAFVLNFGDETTSIDHLPLTIDHEADAWYDMSGRKFNGKPSSAGIYINNGRKVVIK